MAMAEVWGKHQPHCLIPPLIPAGIRDTKANLTLPLTKQGQAWRQTPLAEGPPQTLLLQVTHRGPVWRDRSPEAVGRGTESGPPQGKEQWGTWLSALHTDPTSTMDAGPPGYHMETQQWRQCLHLTQKSPTTTPRGISAAGMGSRQRIQSPNPCSVPNRIHPPWGCPRGVPRGITARMRGSPWGRRRPPAGSRWRWDVGRRLIITHRAPARPIPGSRVRAGPDHPFPTRKSG